MKFRFIVSILILLLLTGCQEIPKPSQSQKMPSQSQSQTSYDVLTLKKEVKIALLLPYKKIGKYASTTTNAVFAYLTTKSSAFELKSYKIESESKKDIQEALDKIQNDGFSYVIAPLTQEGADAVSEINPSINIYFPTIHKDTANSNSNYLFYGGIDYKSQIDMLLKEASPTLVLFFDESDISKSLASYESEQFKQREYDSFSDDNKNIIEYSIPSRTTNLQHYLKDNEKIQKASFFINTPIIKTGMIMSQLTLYDTNATNILSTQVNYDQLLLSMTQYDDRKNMVIANSITEQNTLLIETNSLLGNDIVYDWINYTTTIGVDYFFNQITNEGREYDIDLEDNQMIYKIELRRPGLYRFFSVS